MSKKSGLKVYMTKDDNTAAWQFTRFMIYDHDNQCACWGEDFYYVPFKAIQKYWDYIGEF